MLPYLDASTNLLALAALVVEQLGYGMGWTIYIFLATRVSRGEYRASIISIIGGITALSQTLAGVSSGFVYEWGGYPLVFAASYVLGLPALAAVFFLPRDHVDHFQSPPRAAPARPAA